MQLNKQINPLEITDGRFVRSLFATINYLDRSVISLLSSLEKDFKWTETDYANIVIAFQSCYAIGLLFAGWFIDKIGTKIGYTISILLWSISAMAHALVKSTTGLWWQRRIRFERSRKFSCGD